MAFALSLDARPPGFDEDCAMDWGAAAAYGMVGGAIVETVAIWGYLSSWQSARHRARLRGRQLPRLTRYIDPPADTLVAISRLLLGGLAGFIMHTQISGAISAIAVGASAPALLSQLGSTQRMRPDPQEPQETKTP